MTTNASRRARYLTEMGIGPAWRLRDAPPAAALSGAAPAATDAADEAVATAADTAPQAAVSAAPAVAARPAAAAVATPARAPLPAPEDDVPSWVLEDGGAGDEEHARFAPAGMPGPEEEQHAQVASEAAGIAVMDWDALQAAVTACTRCDLCRGRTNTVFGTGDRQARWLFVGEGPGRNEDLQGEPFVGPAGKLLDNMLAAMGLRRGDNVYIANVVKCRPAGADGRDRPPAPAEAEACRPYLERQIALIRPDVIVALGKSAALALLQADPDASVASMRGRVHRHAGVPLVVTYHPAYLLRAPGDKSKAWRDLCLAMASHAEAAAARAAG